MDKQPALMESPDYLQSLSEKVSVTFSFEYADADSGNIDNSSIAEIITDNSFLVFIVIPPIPGLKFYSSA